MGRIPLARMGLRYGLAASVFVAVAVVGAIMLARSSGQTARGSEQHVASSAAPVRHPFFRNVYGYGGTRLTPAQEGARYRVIVLQQVDAALIPQLKARNPSLRVLMYVDMMSADPRDLDGHSDWVGWTQASANPSWFLLGQDGHQLVFKDYPTSRVMDVGNADYQTAGAGRVAATASADGFDGVFLDDANASLRWVIAGGESDCVMYPTTAQWQAAVYSFLQNVAPMLHQAGLEVVANIGGSTITPGLWQQWNGPIDGAMEESFTNGGAGRDSVANGLWAARLGDALWSEAHRRLALDHAVTRTRSGARYGLATMLLAADGENLYSASTNYSKEVWWPEYRTANRLGRPLGPYRVLPNGVYRRDFSYGVVLVNPRLHAHGRIRLGATYAGSGLGRVRSVIVKGLSGIVLDRV
jgi:Hypothetical glycosyl hydrolase family 15